jgi:hypothetical protein
MEGNITAETFGDGDFVSRITVGPKLKVRPRSHASSCSRRYMGIHISRCPSLSKWDWEKGRENYEKKMEE